jgi:T3SS (YopN, CesT) and YbjN peptide-binding chaperone 3
MTAEPPPDAGAWPGWIERLVDMVAGLADGGSLTVTAAPEGARPVRLRKARLGGFIPAKHESVRPWVRLARAEDHLRGFCVGAEALGGSFPLSPEEHEALLRLGWHAPTAGEGRDYIRFWPDDVPQGPYLPRADAERAASMVAATFREVLTPGAEPPPVAG